MPASLKITAEWWFLFILVLVIHCQFMTGTMIQNMSVTLLRLSVYYSVVGTDY